MRLRSYSAIVDPKCLSGAELPQAGRLQTPSMLCYASCQAAHQGKAVVLFCRHSALPAVCPVCKLECLAHEFQQGF